MSKHTCMSLHSTAGCSILGSCPVPNLERIRPSRIAHLGSPAVVMGFHMT